MKTPTQSINLFNKKQHIMNVENVGWNNTPNVWQIDIILKVDDATVLQNTTSKRKMPYGVKIPPLLWINS